MSCRIPLDVMRQLTSAHERNIYVHPNPLAREIFWQRIDRLARLVSLRCMPSQRGLDFGGGSGSLVSFWAQWGGEVDLVDVDAGDASRLSAYYRPGKLRILETDIARHEVDPYDFIVAADVLEHFPTLDFPVNNVCRLLKSGGLLFISVPTENFLYDLGRKFVGKAKPLDHYHASAEIVSFLEASGFKVVSSESVPRWAGVAVPLFEICLLVKA